MGHGIKFGIAAAGTLFLLTILSWSREPTAPGVASADTSQPTVTVSGNTEPSAIEAVVDTVGQELSSAAPSSAEFANNKAPASSSNRAGDGESEIGCILTEPAARAAAEAGRPNPASIPKPRAQWKKHSVREAETLISIARQYLQDGSRWKEILDANPRLRGPEFLRTGMTLLIPNPRGQSQARQTTAQAATRSPARPAPALSIAPAALRSKATYKVVANDTLSKIALKTLGAKKHWRKIFDANQDRLDGPNDLRVGQTLKIPQG